MEWLQFSPDCPEPPHRPTHHAENGHGYPSALHSPTIHRLILLRQDRHRHCEGLSLFTRAHILVGRGLKPQTNFRLTPTSASKFVRRACDRTPGALIVSSATDWSRMARLDVFLLLPSANSLSYSASLEFPLACTELPLVGLELETHEPHLVLLQGQTTRIHTVRHRPNSLATIQDTSIIIGPLHVFDVIFAAHGIWTKAKVGERSPPIFGTDGHPTTLGCDRTFLHGRFCFCGSFVSWRMGPFSLVTAVLVTLCEPPRPGSTCFEDAESWKPRLIVAYFPDWTPGVSELALELVRRQPAGGR